MTRTPVGSVERLRLLGLIERGLVMAVDIDPPLTEDERRFIGLAPRHLLAEDLAGDHDRRIGE